MRAPRWKGGECHVLQHTLARGQARIRAEEAPGMKSPAGSRSRPRHLTIADVCDELGVARSTFSDWRAKGAAPKCLSLPNGEIRVRRVGLDAWLAASKMGWHDTVDIRRSRMDDPHRLWFTQQVLKGPMERRRPPTFQDTQDCQAGGLIPIHPPVSREIGRSLRLDVRPAAFGHAHPIRPLLVDPRAISRRREVERGFSSPPAEHSRGFDDDHDVACP